MNFYDEEITISGSDIKPPSNAKVMSLNVGASGNQRMMSAGRQRTMFHGNSTDDDGLLQGIIDHDDDDDDDDDIDDDDDDDDDDDNEEDDNDVQLNRQPQRNSSKQQLMDIPRRDTLKHSQVRPTSRTRPKLSKNNTELSDTDSEGAHISQKQEQSNQKSSTKATNEQFSIMPEQWEHLSLPQEFKDLFTYILKYTPQYIDTPYLLQPFIPEYVPAIGDVDAFLKVNLPTLLQPERSIEVQDHLQKLGLNFLDEPSGNQSEPSLLRMKLRSVLTGSGVNSRSVSASLVPVAKSSKDIDRWIAEVEQVHMSQSVYDSQPRKDVDQMIMNWPRSYENAGDTIRDAYQRCLSEQISLIEYIRILCHHLDIDGPLESQTDYLLSVQTLFALYLAANQAWE
uniref:Intraflagellar transport protein 46 homolog n=1 Tax=Glossina brevipalpis TaxID=37001 RepID=A0A1A9WK71_9MUSC